MTNNELIKQEQEAEHYIDTHIIHPQKQVNEFGAQGLWQEVVLTYLKDKALVYIGQALKHLAINHLTDLASWLLEKLQDYLLNLYNKASEEEKEIFKRKIKEKFPNSQLASKL